MSASILDPRMIDPSKPLQISETNITSLTSTLITTPSGNSDTWNIVSTIVQANSALWEESTDITAVTTTVQSNSANWSFGYDVATYVQSNSASWEESADVTILSTIIESNSANWSSAYVTTTALSSNFWNDVYTTVQINSANWEESADILPTVTNYLSTDLVTVSSLNVTQQLLSGNSDLFNLFLTPANTLTTSVCSISGDGVTPFVMNFTNGLLTSITF